MLGPAQAKQEKRKVIYLRKVDMDIFQSILSIEQRCSSYEKMPSGRAHLMIKKKEYDCLATYFPCAPQRGRRPIGPRASVSRSAAHAKILLWNIRWTRVRATHAHLKNLLKKLVYKSFNNQLRECWSGRVLSGLLGRSRSKTALAFSIFFA